MKYLWLHLQVQNFCTLFKSLLIEVIIKYLYSYLHVIRAWGFKSLTLFPSSGRSKKDIRKTFKHRPTLCFDLWDSPPTPKEKPVGSDCLAEPCCQKWNMQSPCTTPHLQPFLHTPACGTYSGHNFVRNFLPMTLLWAWQLLPTEHLDQHPKRRNQFQFSQNKREMSEQELLKNLLCKLYD